MTPKLIITAILIAFINLSQAQETTQLSGDVTVRLKKKELTASYELSNITIDNPKMSFMLHEDFDVEQVYLNGDPIASSKNGRNCESCKVHTIWIDRDITPQDVIKITVEGELDNFAGKDIAYRRGIFEASTKEKWYPIILSTATIKQGVSFSSHTYPYIYDLNIKCGDCKTIRLASQTSAENRFVSDTPSENIQLTLSTRILEEEQTSASNSTIPAEKTAHSETK